MEIRICDSGNLDLAKELCIKNNIGIEFQTFSDPNLENLNDLIDKHKLVISQIPGGKSLEAPFWDLNLGSKMPGIRKVTFDMLNYACTIAKELGCTEIIVRNGYVPGTSPAIEWVERAVYFWKEFLADKDNSITFYIENQLEEDCSIIMKEIDGVADQRLKCCLDVGHVNAYSKVSIGNWINNLKYRIGYIHINNNHGKKHSPGHNVDEHLGLANGKINIDEVLLLSRINCKDAIIGIETKPEFLEESLKWLNEKGYLNSEK